MSEHSHKCMYCGWDGNAVEQWTFSGPHVCPICKYPVITMAKYETWKRTAGKDFPIIQDLHSKLEDTERKRKFLAEDCIRLYKERDMYQASAKAKNGAIDLLQADIKKSETDRDNLQAKLNQVADQWKESQHKIKLLNMALRAANNGNDTDDLRYAYEPGKGIDQLKTVCNGVIVHIPVDWLTEIVDELTTRANNLQVINTILQNALKKISNYGSSLRFTRPDLDLIGLQIAEATDEALMLVSFIAPMRGVRQNWRKEDNGR